ncbi:MAG: ABC transporter permease [Pseudomonadota bacterium]
MSSSKRNPPNASYHYVASQSNFWRSLLDLRNGFVRHRLFLSMSLREFKNQFKGAFIGPFWVSLTTAMTAAGLGILYGQLFDQPLSSHLPYVTIALVVWSMISAFILGGCNVFVANGYIFKEFPLPLSLFSYRLVITQILTSAFRILVLFAILFIFPRAFTLQMLLSITGFALLLWIGFWASLILGVINARYRDFGQLAAASLTFIFFITPIFWVPGRLGPYSVFVDLNPFYHFIEVVRGPLLESPNIALNFIVTGGFAFATPLLGLYLFGRWYHRLPYWC